MSASRHAPGRYLQALAIAKGNPQLALAYAESQGHWVDRSVVVGALKAAVEGHQSGDFTGARATISDAFLEQMRTDSIPLRLAMRRVPMHTRIYANTAGVVASQIAEGAAIPVLKGTWSPVTLRPKKCAGIVVQTLELLKSTDPGAPLAVSADLARAVAAEENRNFLQPNVSDSILNGAPTFASNGNDAGGIAIDLAALVRLVPGAFRAGSAWVMSPGTAGHIAATAPTLCQGLGPAGGTLLGLPVITAQEAEEVGSPQSGVIALVAADEIYWAQGGVELTASAEAALEMTDAATGDAATPTAGTTSLVSMYQENAVATRAIRESSWYARSGSAAYVVVSY